MVLLVGAFVAVLATAPSASDLEVERAEAARAIAVATGDVAALDRLLDDRYQEVDVDGRVRGRPEGLSVDPTSVVTDHVLTRRRGNAAIVVARTGEVRVLRVWILQNHEWRLASQHAVRIDLHATPAPKLPASRPIAAPPLGNVHRAMKEVLQAQDGLDFANAMNDVEAFVRLTDADFIVVTNRGFVRTKDDRVIEERIGRLERRPQRPVPIRDQISVRLYGSTAIVTARNWPRTFEGEDRPPVRYTRVWVKGTKGWQQLANISTTVNAPSD